jgi:hypothetical protein
VAFCFSLPSPNIILFLHFPLCAQA